MLSASVRAHFPSIKLLVSMAASSSHSVATHLLAAGLASVITISIMRYRARKSDCSETVAPDTPQSTPAIILEKREAAWLAPLYEDTSLEDVDSAYPEWHDDAWRTANGWRGKDFIHSRTSKGPRILRYFHDRSQKMLVGAAVFGPDSESHAGCVHCSLGMTDKILTNFRSVDGLHTSKVGYDEVVPSLILSFHCLHAHGFCSDTATAAQ